MSADALHDENRGMVIAAVLTLSTNSIAIEGRPVRFGPGLNLTAEISTGRRRLIHYLLDAVKRTASESMVER